MMIWHGDKILTRIEKQSASIKSGVAQVIADKAKKLCPVDSGALQASIGATEDGIEVTEDYAGAVELGTAEMAAKPFVRPAIEQFSKNDLDKCI